MKIEKHEITKEDILTHWQQRKSVIDWRQLSDKEKKHWLQACLHHSNLPTQINLGYSYILEGYGVNCKADFFCLLGETFFGYGGYFGQDLDGFDDCFVEISRKQSKDAIQSAHTTVTIKGYKELEEVLNETTPNYLSTAIEIMREHGLTVNLE